MNKTQIFENFEAFQKRPDKSVNGVSPEFAKKYTDYAKQNETNVGCWNCARCTRCLDCNDCTNCINCTNCGYCKDCEDCNDCMFKFTITLLMRRVMNKS